MRLLPALLATLLLMSGPVLSQTEVVRVYTAESLWGAKHQIEVDRMWFFLRDPWLKRPSGTGVRVAIIDTGIDTSHPDLASSVVLWRDFVGDKHGNFSERPYDDNGHGTHVAAIVAGRGHPQLNPVSYYWMSGERGVAPDAKLLVAKAMDHAGIGTDDVVARAIRWAVAPNGDIEGGAHIINLSIGVEDAERPTGRGILGARVGSETRRAVEEVASKGVVVVVSSGNDGANEVSEPGDIDLVISVGAVDRGRRVAEFSNYGAELDLVAPGVLISAYPRGLDVHDFSDDGYVGMAGTSMAAPVVTGVIALMMEAQPALKVRDKNGGMEEKVAFIQDVLRRSSVPLQSDGGRDGAGLVNAYRSVAAVDAGTGELDYTSSAAGVLLVSLAAYSMLDVYRRLTTKRAGAELGDLEEYGAEEGEGDDFPPGR